MRQQYNLQILGIALVGTSLAPSAIAHNVKTDADVGATFHLEPNHQPRAGESSRVWFALTRQGGTPIPLADCDCQLVVYDSSKTPPQAVLEPELSAIDAERYRDIPGATFAFPAAGVYELELKGTPKSAGDFQPFRLTYPVTVTPGTQTKAAPASTPSVVVTAPEPVSPASRLPALGIGIALGLLLAWLGFWVLKKR